MDKADLPAADKASASHALKMGRLDEALEILDHLRIKMPDDPDIWAMRAALYARQGNLESVIDCTHQGLALDPSHPVSNALMGDALTRQGFHQKAMAYYRKALASNPDDPRLLYSLGNTLVLSGKFEEARDAIARVVELIPVHADCHCSLGNIYSKLNAPGQAILHFRRALEINPNLLQAWLSLGDIYSNRVGSPEQAEDCFRNALKINPHHLGAESGLASMLRFQGKYVEALERIHVLLKKFPGNASLMAGEADILEQMGELGEAYEKAGKVVERDQSNSMALGVMLRLCHKFGGCEEVVRQTEGLVSGNMLNNLRKKDLLFFLGNLYDRLGNYDKAFAAIQQGNDLTPVEFDLQYQLESFAAIKQIFSKEALKQLPAARHGDRRPVFIVGMPRSGTSLVEQILASHPDVYGAGERNYINEIAAEIPEIAHSNVAYPGGVASLDQPSVDKLAKRYLDKIAVASGHAARITDKMPHNFLHLGLIALLFPGAHIIHCIRDPRDTCLSIYFQNFGLLHRYATNLQGLGQYFRLYLDLMKHWEPALELPFMTVQYEELVADQERVSRKMVDFIGLDWSEDCLRFHESRRAVATVSYDQVRQPMYTKSISRWKSYERHLGPLLDALGEVADESASKY